jgi:hypothetical protein
MSDLIDALAKEIAQAKKSLLVVQSGSPAEHSFTGYINGLEFALKLAREKSP